MFCDSCRVREAFNDTANSPELPVLPADSLQAPLLLLAHRAPLWTEQTEENTHLKCDRLTGEQQVSLNSQVVYLYQYVLIFLICLIHECTNPFMSLQGPSHSVLPHGLRIRTRYTASCAVCTCRGEEGWMRREQEEEKTMKDQRFCCEL